MTTTPTPLLPRRGITRRLSAWLFPRRRLQLGMLLATPVGWLVLVYLGSLFILLLSSLWAYDASTGNVEPFAWSFDAFESLFSTPAYQTVTVRTLGMAALVTVTDA